MNVHKNAPLTPGDREAMVRAVVNGLSKVAAAQQFNTTAKTVAKWHKRFSAEGVAGLRDRDGSLRPATWVILDRGKHIATRCSENQTAEAEKCLAAYLAAKHQPKRQRNDIEDIDIADVISIYVDDRRLLDHPSATKLFGRLERINEFWGGKKLSEINGETCCEYARHIGSEGGARRDLEDLRVAVNHHAKEDYHRGIVRVVLPPKGKARDRWLTRDEVARLLRVCWRARE